MTKTVKLQPSSVRLEKKLAWIACEEKRLSELEASISKATEVLTNRRATVQEEKKAGIGATPDDGRFRWEFLP